MPCTGRAVRWLEEHGVRYAPGKAVNAGGVAVSGLEMSQDRLGLQWTEAEVDARLRGIMHNIYTTCKAAADEYGVSLAAGAHGTGMRGAGRRKQGASAGRAAWVPHFTTIFPFAGANIAGFSKVAEAVLAQGAV